MLSIFELLLELVQESLNGELRSAILPSVRVSPLYYMINLT